MNSVEKVYQAYRAHITEHMEANRKGALAMKRSVEHSPLCSDNGLDRTLQIPKIYSEETIDTFREIARTTYGIFDKVIKEYIVCEDYRKLFPFPKELEELILLPAQYEINLPMARFDIFYHEDDGSFRFCEINTDGTAAQLRDLQLRKAYTWNPAHQAVSREYELEPFELFKSWVDAFLALYQTYPKARKRPHVAMVDFLENSTWGDFEEFALRFREAGVDCEICDIRELIYENGELLSPSGLKIDAIYRRAVTVDVMEHYNEVSAFLNAVRNDNVFLAGGFRTQIIHSKWLFYVLHLDRTKKFLTEEELRFVEEHIPLTIGFSPEHISLAEVQRRKDDFIIKPMDAYASKGIYAAGHEYTDEDWKRITEEYYGKGLICQEYCPQYLTENIDFAWGDGEWHRYMNMTGLYVYNGKFKGILMRMAEGDNIIVAHQNERTVPVFMLKSS